MYVNTYVYYINFFDLLLAKTTSRPKQKYFSKTGSKRPDPFSRKHDIGLILFLNKQTTCFHLSVKLKSNKWVTSFLKKLSEK